MKRLLALALLFVGTAFADVLPITPVAAGTTTITAGVASAAAALPATIQFQHQVELQNNGTAVIFVEFCNSSTCAAAVATGYPILVGQSKVVTVPGDTTTIATISGTASQTLYVTIGTGQ